MSANNTVSDSYVDLGFPVIIEKESLYSLRSHYLPLGKVGGMPSWLNPINLPSSESLTCKICSKPLAFLIQIYAPNLAKCDHSFHRTLYVFICRQPECCRANDASNFRIFRCQLPRVNDFYSSEGPLDPDVDGDVPDPYSNSTYSPLCLICGCLGSKKCVRCMSANYCSQEHQKIDWRFGHKTSCNTTKANDLPPVEKEVEDSKVGSDYVKKRPVAKNPFVFPEYGIEMDRECNNVSSRARDSDDDDDDDDDNDVAGGGGGDGGSDNEEELNKRLGEYYEYIKKNEHMDQFSQADLEGLQDSVTDVAFKRFRKIVAQNPEQILRYTRNGKPLSATDHAPFPYTVPACASCGAPRCFEFQLMPHLLSLIDVDKIGSSIDWASVSIFTCSRNCEIEKNGYMEEFIFKQDFVLAEPNASYNS